MTKEFDPMDGLSPDDMKYLADQKSAFARQQAAHGMHSTDADRASAAEAHRRSVMQANGVEPPAGPLQSPGSQASPSAPTGLFSVLRAVPDTSGDARLAPTGEKYAPDWRNLKERISSHDGTWIVSRHEFPAHVAFVLGFFGKDGWETPPDAQKESFEVIVKNGRVFRTDPE